MVASALYGLAGKLVGELCSPVFEDYVGKPWGLGKKKELEKLSNTMSTIQAVLLDAEEKQRTNNQVKDWLVKIKLVFYDLEDLLQEVTYEALKRQVKTKNKKAKKVRIFFSRSNQVMYRLKMGGKVKSIREKLDAIASDSNTFSLAQRHEEMPAATRRKEETHSFVPVERFIGRDADQKRVTEFLLESDGIDNVSVISIVGIGGMGKTTLAQSIYSSEAVKANFELMMWVCVSDPYDVKLICEKIIESSTRKKCEGLQMDIVKDELKKAVDGKKYLLVLDDVWNECPEKWLNLEVLLAGGAQGSKILITARALLVARASKSIETHVLRGLPHEKAWALFKQVAFKQGVEPQSSTIFGIGKEVAERCAGVPLAIKTTGSLLGLKEREADWVDFKKNVLPLITQDSDGKIVQILKLSYENLSAPLKRCFAYCAIFPKNRKIWKRQLVRMWMAQGLIQLDGTTRSLEDVGEQYFMDLVDRSLLEGIRSGDGIVHLCKMHDLIHDLALSLGENEFWRSGPDVNCIDMRMVRHAWVTSPSPCISTNLLHARKLRSLVVRTFFPIHDDVIIGNFKQLRMLEFVYLHAARVPDFVDRLIFLKYLNLSGNTFESLPKSVCSMYNLQTLILNDCINLKELPTGTKNMVSLRHLKISQCDKLSHMPGGLGELTCLRTLTHFVMGREGTNCSELGELKSLVNLKGEFRIRNLRGSKVAKCRSSGQSCFPTPLAELQFITGLELKWCDEDEVDKKQDDQEDELESLKPHPNLERLELRNYGGKRFPSWMERANIGDSLPNIVRIRCWSCKGLRHFPPLGLLPSLRELYLADMTDLQDTYENEWNNNNNNQYFPVLEKLSIRNCPLLFADGRQFLGLNSLRELYLSGVKGTLPGWLPSLPHLQTLELSRCENMLTLPEWMGNLKSLQKIRIQLCKSLESIPDCVQYMASLQEIRLEFCESLASIPDCVKHLVSLQLLEVRGCRELYRRYNKENGEYWHEIAHIPKVSVIRYHLRLS